MIKFIVAVTISITIWLGLIVAWGIYVAPTVEKAANSYAEVLLNK